MITVATDAGKITVPKSVIGNIVKYVIDSYKGKVILSDSKGRVNKLAYKLGTKEKADNIQVQKTPDGINIRAFVVLRFGTSIKETSHRLIGDIRATIKEATGIDTENISIVITGMISKNIAPRHIEIIG